MSPDDELPEGTDTIIQGAGVGSAYDEALDRAAVAPAIEGTSSFSGGQQEGGQGNASSSGQESAGGPSSQAGGQTGSASDFRSMFFDRVESLRGQAGDSARDYVQAGKDRATSALDDLVKMVDDAASEIDSRLGAQYGDYARRAAQGLTSFTDSVREKDVDALFADARNLVAKSPTIAIGAAATLGFVVARLVRAGIAEGTTDRDAPAA